jgi:stigma-specific protein Stig1
MDGQRFDALVKGLGRDATRRRLIGGLAGSAAALGLGVLATSEADAKPKASKKCKGKNKKRCGGKCTKVKTSTKNCGDCQRQCSSGEICSHGLTCQDAACLAVTATEGNVTLASNGGLTLHSDLATEEFGAFDFEVPDGTTFADLSSIQTDFAFADGSSCGANSPRFTMSFKSISNCFLSVQIKPGLCGAANSSGASGEMVGDDTPFDWTSFGSNKFCPQNISSYTQALATFGSQEIDELFVVLDSSNSQPQTVTLKPCVKVSDNS